MAKSALFEVCAINTKINFLKVYLWLITKYLDAQKYFVCFYANINYTFRHFLLP
jgi:hypothetical protein